MKLKSLFLGSIAAAGLSTAGYAADLGVLTSLDVCDALGISGLTISSDTNCLQISGQVSYEFSYGDWNTESAVATTFDDNRNIIDAGSVIDPVTGEEYTQDWESKVEAWLKVVGTADSDFGPASATIKLKSVERLQTWNEGQSTRTNVYSADLGTLTNGDSTAGFEIDEAYVSVGDSTVIMAGIKSSIANLGDDEPFNFLKLFSSDSLDGGGIGITGDSDFIGGASIQVVSDLGNGVSVGVGLENLDGAYDLGNNAIGGGATVLDASTQGTLVGVVNYAGEGITAHVTGAAFGILDGDVDGWLVHAGATGTFDAFKVRGALAYVRNDVTDTNLLNGLVSAEGTFDLFTLAASGEFANVDGPGVDYTDYDLGASAGMTVTDGISINLGARYFHDDDADLDTTQVAVQLIAAVTESIKLTGEVGAYFGSKIETNPAFQDDQVVYGAAEMAWAPGGGFTSSVKGEVNSEEAYKVTFKASKAFQ